MSASDTTEPELVDVAGQTTAVIGGVVQFADLPGFFDRSFPRLVEVLAIQEVAIVSPAFGLYHGEPTEMVDMEIGFVTDRSVEPEGEVRPTSLPGGRVARLVHQGGYDGLGSSWEHLRSWIQASGLLPGRELWEVYVTEPSPDMNPADLRTELNWLVEG